MEKIDLAMHLRTIEAVYIKDALRFTKGNVQQAGDLLSVNRTTLISRIRKLGLSETLEELRSCGIEQGK